ncbi:ATP-binding cassette sub- C member 8 [Thoreauomyces humboldtii]|nr:ATP-binding cassette sub- C member 8 [Thoreauomyces humboldtii]
MSTTEATHPPIRAAPSQVQRTLLSAVTFSWIYPLLKKGEQSPLTEDDLPQLNDSSRARTVGNLLAPFWRARREHVLGGATAAKGPSFAWSCASPFVLTVLLALFCQSVKVLVAIAMPLLIGQVIAILDPKADHSSLFFPTAYHYALVYFAMALLSIVAHYSRSCLMLDAQIRLRSVVVGAIYRKTFRLSLAARVSTSPGAINSFADTDAGRISTLPDTVITGVTALAQVCLAIYFLANSLGVSTLVTAVVYVLMGLLITFLSPYEVKAQDTYMTLMDKRISLLRELLQGMRTLKLEAAERILGKAVDVIRSEQLRALVRLLRWESIILVFLIVQMDAMPSIAIASFHLLGGTVTATSAFTILGFLDALQGPSGSLTYVITTISSSIPSVRRISKFLTRDEDDPQRITTTRISIESNAADAILMHRAAFAFETVLPTDDVKDDGEKKPPGPFKLADISLVVPRGSLVIVVGPVGSGKSTFLSALVGSISLTSGTSVVNGSIAYCPALPFIMSGTIESNIRGFAGNASTASVREAVKATCLDRDISFLPEGLATRIGERGVSLSGGQKARVALARAIACNPDVIVLDDPLSSLDPLVGKTVLEGTILRRLKSTTVVLATHDLRVASKADLVLVFDKGHVVERGTAKQLREAGGMFADMVAHFSEPNDGLFVEEALPSSVSPCISDGVTSSLEKETRDALATFETSQVVAEDRRIGSVKLSIYRSYFSTAGYAVSAIPFFLLPLGVLADATLQLSLVWWADDYLKWTDRHYFTLFYCIGIARTIMAFITGWSCMYMCFRASKAYHWNALKGILSAPVQCVTVLTVGSPYMLLLLVILALPAVYLFRFFQPSYRELSRLQSVLQSPLSAHLSESFDGVATIRMYGWVDAFVDRQEDLTDLSHTALLLTWSARWWFYSRIAVLSSLVVLVVLTLAGAGLLSDAVSGLMLVSAISISANISNTMDHLSRIEVNFNAVERLDYYRHLPSEQARGTVSVPAEWPSRGAIAISNLTLAYDAASPVVHNISLSIPAGQHIAICGRTGSGKSTLCSALFRLLTPKNGSILIDGVDIADIDLYTLRSRLMIVPQDPVLSSGTLRFNLDRHGSYLESSIWEALDLAGLKDHVRNLPGKLDHEVSSSTSLSSGQRQLLFMAKAILRAPHIRILVLDESTASVDTFADDRIGTLVRERFEHATVVCIAHRLSTIAGMQRVIVMGEGRVLEEGAVWELVERKGSIFAGMVESAGRENADAIRKLARKACIGR